MKQTEFEQRHASFWSNLEQYMVDMRKPFLKKIVIRGEGSTHIEFKENFPENYRRICHHLSLARSRYYSPLLVEQLENLVFNAHQIFYKHNTNALFSILIYFTSGFAQSVRKEKLWVFISAILFFGSLVTMLITLQYFPDRVYTIMSAEQITQIESMYDPSANIIGRERDSGTDFQMFGFYIFNNTSIGLKTFASGLLFGIGAVITLFFNGLYIGSVAGHLTSIGFGSTFWPFVSGHSALELSAVVLSGAAGLKLGASIISPGRKTRLKSLHDSAKEALYMMYGVSAMFITAAFIEAYWSSMSNIAEIIKYVVGVISWILLLAYFVFSGRKNAIR